MKKDYDVIIICFSNPLHDARTINLVRTLIKYQRKVALVTPDYNYEPDYINNSDYYKCSVKLNQKVRYSQKEFTKAVKKLNLSTSFVHAGDFYSLTAAKSIKIKCKAKLIYDSREIYSQLNSLKNRPFARKLIEFREKYLVTYVDKIVVTADVDETYLKKYFMHNIPYYTIKNLPPQQELKSSDYIRREYNIKPDSLVLLYQGWILEGRGLDSLVKAIKDLSFVELVIVGGGEYTDELKKIASSLELENRVHFTGLIPYDHLSKITMSADVGLVLFEDTSISYQNALPNKLFEFIQSAIPVITTNQKTMREVVDNENIGLVVNRLDVDELQKAIHKLSDSNTRNYYRENILKIRNKYNYELQEVEILKVFS